MFGSRISTCGSPGHCWGGRPWSTVATKDELSPSFPRCSRPPSHPPAPLMQTSVSPSKAGAADAVGGAGAVMAVDRGNWADLEGSGGGCPLHIEPVPRTALEVVITGQTNLTLLKLPALSSLQERHKSSCTSCKLQHRLAPPAVAPCLLCTRLSPWR